MATYNQKNKRKSMPSQKSIWDYWKDRLLEYDVELYENEKCCFACGYKGTLHRSHIIPCRTDQDNDINNIHLLCSSCHSLTEGKAEISVDYYWTFLRTKNYWISDMLNVFSQMNLKSLEHLQERILDLNKKTV